MNYKFGPIHMNLGMDSMKKSTHEKVYPKKKQKNHCKINAYPSRWTPT